MARVAPSRSRKRDFVALFGAAALVLPWMLIHHFHGLGLAWISSRTLHGGLSLVARYHRVISTAIEVHLTADRGRYRFEVTHPLEVRIAVEAVDAFFTVIVRFCREMAGEDFAPDRVELQREDSGRREAYAEVFRAPVLFARESDALVFDR